MHKCHLEKRDRSFKAYDLFPNGAGICIHSITERQYKHKYHLVIIMKILIELFFTVRLINVGISTRDS